MRNKRWFCALEAVALALGVMLMMRGGEERREDVLLTRDPALDQDKQNEQIRDLLREGIDLLVLNPVDFREVTSVLEELRAAGVLVVVVDSQVSEPALARCTGSSRCSA